MGVLINNLPWHNELNRQRAEADAAFLLSEDANAAEFRAELPRRIAAEKDAIDAAIAGGRVLVANKVDYTFVIHRANCGAIRHQIDRDEAWARYDDDPRGLSYSYDMPNLLTPDEVEALDTYRACLTCNPDTARRIKKRDHSQRPTALRNMSIRHVGRDFETLEGSELGELIAYTMAEGSVTLHFPSGDHIGFHDDEVIMRQKSAV